MRGRIGVTLFLVPFLSACPQQGGDEPDPITALSASVVCTADDAGVTWDFSFRLEGPALERGTTVYADAGDEGESTGFAMTIIGEDPQGGLEFATSVSGTAPGNEPQVGELAHSCEDEADIQFRFCATHSSTTDEPCWACGDDDSSSPPGNAIGWVGC